MKKTLLFTIAALITALNAMATQHMPDKNWNPVSGDVIYNATDVINIHITGTGDKEYDRLEITGALTLGGATLNVFPCYDVHPIGHRFVIFKAPAINGKFSYPPLIDAGGSFFVLSYEKKNGVDIVVLTAVTKLFGLDISTSGSTTPKPDYNYTLTVVTDPSAGGNVVPTQATFKVCGEIDIEVTDNLGYAFTHWTQQGGAIIANTASPTTTATMPARDVTITANFEFLIPEAPTANNVTVCYDGVEHSAGADPPLHSSIVWYEDATGTATTTAPTGTTTGTYTAWAASKHDNTGKESDTRTEVTLTINALPEMNCPADYDVCIDDSAFALSEATPASGTYSGPGVTNDDFYPATAGIGTHTIVYTYTDGNNCTASCVFTITVNPHLPAPTAQPATDVTANTFTANWTELSGTVTYTLQVAANTAFNPIVQTYNVDNGTFSQTVVIGCSASYYYRVKAVNACGESNPSNVIDAGTFTITIADSRDNQSYATVQIGNQCWMAENLKYLPSVVGSGTGSGTDPYHYVYDYNGTNVSAAKATTIYSTYGVLYNWPAAMNGEASSTTNPSGVQGVCPTGWHLPSDAEWTQLTDFLGGSSVAGGKMKTTTTHWDSPNIAATNSSGFSALPGGLRSANGDFESVGSNGSWWSATEASVTGAYSRRLDSSFEDSRRSNINKRAGFSVRCLRDI